MTEAIEVRRTSKISRSSPKKVVFVRNHPLELARVLGKLRRIRDVFARKQAALCEFLGADEQRVARERRKALVRRFPVPGRSQRKHLPDRLPRVRKEVDKTMRLGAEIAYSKAAR